MVSLGDSPVIKTATIDAAAILPKAPNVDMVNDYEAGRLASKKEAMADDAMRLSKQKAAYDAMIDNPEAAPEIAKQYGIEYNPDVERLIRNPAQAKKIVEGAAMAKSLGISHPNAAIAFTREYVSSGGNLEAAQQAVSGMQMLSRGPSGLKSVPRGGSVINPLTGEVVYQDGRVTSGSSSAPKMPVGYMWDQETGQATRIPGVSLDPMKDPSLPADLKIRIDRVKSNPAVSEQEVLRVLDDVKKWQSQKPIGATGNSASLPLPPVPVPANIPLPSQQDLDTSEFGF